MKNIVLAAVLMIGFASYSIAGGDFEDIEPEVVPVLPLEEDNSRFYAGLALAYNQTYALDYGFLDDSTRTQDQTGKIVGFVGYDFNKYVGVEGRIGGSFVERDYSTNMTYSIFLKPQYPVSEDFTLYGLLGFGLVQVDGYNGKVPAYPTEIGKEILNDTSFQWGIGLDYKVHESFSIFIDYTKLASDADVSTYTYGYEFPRLFNALSLQDITIGINYKF